MTYFPSASVTVPLSVPLWETPAAMSGSPFSSTTVPLTLILSCEYAVMQSNVAAVQSNMFFIFFIFIELADYWKLVSNHTKSGKSLYGSFAPAGSLPSEPNTTCAVKIPFA